MFETLERRVEQIKKRLGVLLETAENGDGAIGEMVRLWIGAAVFLADLDE